MINYQPIVQRTRAYLCLDCGKCTSTCPLARVDLDFSPRRIVERVVFGEAESVIADPHLWSCMTCGLCTTRCPSDVDFSRFIIEMRAEAFQAGEPGIYAHDGILHEIMRLQAKGLHQERNVWIPDDMRVAQEGEYLYFVGCLPFFDIIFKDLDIKALDIARSAVRLLNRVGITPVVSDQERCCGADLLLAGDTNGFRRLAELNVEAIEATGAKTVIFTCAECYYAFRTDYPAHLGALPFEMMHLTELLTAEIEAGPLEFAARPESVTYHDACRLGRYLEIYDPPREVIRAVPESELIEMEDSRERALCCGSTGWVNCSGSAKLIQRDRLRQARETGAEVMLTACPKCQIHLSCAARHLEAYPGSEDMPQAVEVHDLTSWIGRALNTSK